MLRNRRLWEILILSVILVLSVFLLTGVSTSSELLERRGFRIERISYHPVGLGEELGKAVSNMLFTRLSRYFDPAGSDPLRIFLDVTKIGKEYSLDGYVEDLRGRRSYFAITVVGEGEIARGLSDVSNVASRFAYAEITPGKNVVPRRTVSVSGKKERFKSMEALRKYLPRGRVTYHSGGRGDYRFLAGGDMDLDGEDEVVGANDDRVDIWKVGDEGGVKVRSFSLPPGVEVSGLECADLDRDMRQEALVNIDTGQGARWLLVDFDEEKSEYVKYEGEGWIGVYDHPRKGVVGWSVDEEGKLFFFLMKNGTKKIVDEGKISFSISFDSEKKAVYWDGKSFRVVYASDGRIWEKNPENAFMFEGKVLKLKAYDLDGDGSQELIVVASKIVRGTFFESLRLERGTSVIVLKLSGKGFEEVYKYENDDVIPGGFYVRFQPDSERYRFILLSLVGSEFAPRSMEWRKVIVR